MLSVAIIGGDPWVRLGVAELARCRPGLRFIGGAAAAEELSRDRLDANTAATLTLAVAASPILPDSVVGVCVVFEVPGDITSFGYLAIDPSMHPGDVTAKLDEFIAARAAAAATEPQTASPQLSERERAVLVAVLSGASSGTVAAGLGIRESTVNAYLTRIRTKYALVGRPAPSRVDLMRRALEDGLLEHPAQAYGNAASPE